MTGPEQEMRSSPGSCRRGWTRNQPGRHWRAAAGLPPARLAWSALARCCSWRHPLLRWHASAHRQGMLPAAKPALMSRELCPELVPREDPSWIVAVGQILLIEDHGNPALAQHGDAPAERRVAGQRRVRPGHGDDRQAEPDRLIQQPQGQGVADSGRPLVDRVERGRRRGECARWRQESGASGSL